MFIGLIKLTKMKFIVLSIVFIVNLLVCGNALNSEKQFADSLVNALKSNGILDQMFVDDFAMKAHLGSIAGFHFSYEIELKSIQITGLGEINFIEADVVKGENGDKFIGKFTLGEVGNIQIVSTVSINGYEPTLVLVDIVDPLVIDLSVSFDRKSSTEVNIAGGEQILLHQLPSLSPLSLVQDKILPAFSEMLNTKAKPLLVNLIRDVTESELLKINNVY